MKVLALEGSGGGVSFYRLFIPGNELNKRKHDFRAAKLIFEDIFNIIDFHPDLIYVQRVANPKVLHDVVMKWKIPYIYDIDDDFMHIPASNPAVGLKEEVPRIKVFMQKASAVTVSTQPLKDLYTRFNSNITVVPNAIPDNWLKLPTPDESEIPIIGYAGGGTHSADLDIVRKALQKLRKKYEFRLLFFGILPEWAKDMDTIHVKPVVPEDYMNYFCKLPITIAIAPLVDNLFNSCKSNLRLLEYSILEAPVICSDVYPFQSCPKDACLRVKDDEWYDAIESLLLNKKRCKVMGMNLKQWVKENYSISKVAESWENVFNKVLKKGEPNV